MATTTILGDLVTEIVGPSARVEVLMAPGQDPHGFSPSAQQAANLRRADLVVANGLQLEESLLDTLAAAEQDGATILRLAEELDPIAFDERDGGDAHAHGEEHAHDEEESDDSDPATENEDEHGHADEDHEGHAHGPEDPHVWFDPVRMADGARVIADHLAEVDDTLEDEEWSTRGEVAAEGILAAHEEVEQVLAEIPEECRRLVTNHDSVGYFAERYDFEVVGTVVPGTSSQVDPGAQAFAELAETLRGNQVPAIFTETTQSTRLAESLAAEVNRKIQVVELYTGSLGEPGSGADTYTGWLATNAQRIADALSGC